jgi:hypothetical protein
LDASGTEVAIQVFLFFTAISNHSVTLGKGKTLETYKQV